MKLVSQCAKIFWRTDQTFHVRIYEMDDCKAVQWWNEVESGYFCLEKNCKVELILENGQPFMKSSFKRELDLPPLPRVDLHSFRVCNDGFQEKLRATKQLNEVSQACVQQSNSLVDLVEETSPNKIQKQLRLSRTKNKIKAVLAFKK
jgi:hypothetical protein